MSENLPKQPQQSSDEVDLGQVFKLIGNMFDRFSKFIASIFNGIFKLIVQILSHFYKRYIWYVGAVVIGGIGGYFWDKNSTDLYAANMTIETNFSAARQVYENIAEFHQLAYVDKDSVELSERLNISRSDASKLKTFSIEPIINENVIAKSYSEFYLNLDSISRLEMTYDRYKASLTIDDHRTHSINLTTTDKTIYEKIADGFVGALSSNPYLDEILKTNVDILKKQDKALEKQVELTDSLVKQYLSIRVNESKKPNANNSATNVYMRESNSAGLFVNELEVLEVKNQYEKERRSIDSLLVNQNNVINVLTKFPKTGYEVGSWTNKKKLSLPLLLAVFVASIFMLIGLGKFLKKLN